MHIHTHRWQPLPDAPARERGIYLLHGVGEHGARYARLAERLAKAGWTVGGHDHPGHGRSEGARGRIDPAGSLTTQAAMQVSAFTVETGAEPYLFGHSLGGVVAAELVLAHGLPVAGLLLSAPAIAPHIGMLDRLKLQVMTWVAPTVALKLPYDASRLTHDEDEIRIAEADPLQHSFKSAELVNWLITSANGCISKASAFEIDVLLMIAGADSVIDTAVTRQFAERIPDKHLTRHDYAGFRHEILNETPERRERVMKDILDWLDNRT